MPNFHGAKSSRRVSANAGETESTAEMGPGIEGGSCFLLYERIRLGAMVSQREVSIFAPKPRANHAFACPSLVICHSPLSCYDSSMPAPLVPDPARASVVSSNDFLSAISPA